VVKVTYVQFQPQTGVLSFRERPPLPVNPLTGGLWPQGSHRSIRELFQTIREFTASYQSEGHTVRVLAADDPERRRIGYVAFTIINGEEVSYGANISVFDIPFSMEHDFTEEERGSIQNLWNSAVGRQHLAALLQTRLPYEPG
jgi:hypothetical protein